MATAIGPMVGAAHAREGDGGQEHEKQQPGHESKRIALRDRELRLHEFFDRIGGDYPTQGSDGGDSSGKGGTGVRRAVARGAEQPAPPGGPGAGGCAEDRTRGLD
jgi:hypothetical protein